MNKNRLKTKKRQESRTHEQRKKSLAVLTASDFSKSFRLVKHTFFQVKPNKPKTDVDKILFVSQNDLAKALEIISNSEYEKEQRNQRTYIQLDEKIINQTFEKITH